MITPPSEMEKEKITERKAYKQEKIAQAARWRADITSMENELLKAKSDVAVSHEDELAALKTQLADVETHLSEHDEYLDEAWHDITTLVNDSWHHMSAAFDELQAKLAAEMERQGVEHVTHR